VALVVGVFELADYGCRRADTPCEFPLRKPGVGSQVVDFSCHIVVSESLFERLLLLGVIADVAVIGGLERL